MILVSEGVIKSISDSYELALPLLSSRSSSMSFSFVFLHYQHANFRFVNANSNEPIVSQKQRAVRICVWFHRSNLLPTKSVLQPMESYYYSTMSPLRCVLLM